VSVIDRSEKHENETALAMKSMHLFSGLLAMLLLVSRVGQMGTTATAADLESASSIRSDERIVFFPTAASMSASGDVWRIPIHGWIFEPEDDDFFCNQVLDSIRSEVGQVLSKSAQKNFDKRIRLFLVDNESDKRVGYRIAGRTAVAQESKSDGHFSDLFKISVKAAQPHVTDGWLQIDATLSSKDRRRFIGRTQLLSPNGWLVVSDIDDTVKISNGRFGMSIAVSGNCLLSRMKSRGRQNKRPALEIG
jgi:hypothetical protein